MSKLSKDLKKYLAFIAIIVILAVIMAVMFRQKAELQLQIKQQQEQMERQNVLINGLENNNENGKAPNETVPVVTSDTIKSQLNSISELVTQEYVYRNADQKESSETWMFGWTRPFSSKSILILYDGTIKAGIDFSEIDVVVDDEKQTVVVTLPKSEITDNYIPQDKIEVVEVKDGLFNKVTIDNFNDFVAEQKEVMEAKAIEQGLLGRADEEAHRLVESFVSVLPGMDAYTLTVQ